MVSTLLSQISHSEIVTPYTQYTDDGKAFFPVPEHFAERYLAERYLVKRHFAERIFCRSYYYQVENLTNRLLQNILPNNHLPKIGIFLWIIFSINERQRRLSNSWDMTHFSPLKRTAIAWDSQF